MLTEKGIPFSGDLSESLINDTNCWRVRDILALCKNTKMSKSVEKMHYFAFSFAMSTEPHLVLLEIMLFCDGWLSPIRVGIWISKSFGTFWILGSVKLTLPT